MTPERWRKIEQVYASARVQKPHQRESFLDGACGDDSNLRREIELLLERGDSQNLSAEGAPTETIAHIGVGSQLGPYRIEAPIGSGGMGEVFRAIDTRLGRPVAIKTSREQFSERFNREARAISSLNHPHICTLYDVGPNYLVMELCEGETLAARLKRGKLSIEDTLRFGAQIADALSAAHSKGIVHRDLKPHNVMLSKSGIKVLDFGLAKSSQDETLTASHAVMGTPAYMAPEQREGKECDARTDIYALGLILAEMATGRRDRHQDLTGHFAQLVQRALAADPDSRWHSAADLAVQLQWLAQPAPATADSERHPPRLFLLKAALVAMAVVALAAIFAIARYTLSPAATLDSATAAPKSEFDITLDTDSSGFDFPTPSPDGSAIVYRGHTSSQQPNIWIRRLDSVESQPLAGTEGAGSPFWSFDGRWIGFLAGGKVKKVPATGGVPQTIAVLTTGLQEPVWGRAEILFRPGNRMPLFHLPESGGTPVQVTHLDEPREENSHRSQQFLPDGRNYFFTARSGNRAMNALYIGSLDTGKVKRVMPIDSAAFYIPATKGPGTLLFHRDGALVGQKFNLETEALEGEPSVVLNRIAYNPTGLTVSFRSSRNGDVAVVQRTSVQLSDLVWYSRAGERQSKVGGEPNTTIQPHLSPNGTRVLYSAADPRTGNRDIFVRDLARGITTQMVSHGANDWHALWSPDGKNILFGSDRTVGVGQPSFIKSALGSSTPETAFTGTDSVPSDWSRDGRWIIGGGGREIWSSRAVPGGKPTVLIPPKEGTYYNAASFSPDTRWITYVSSETGQPEVYVRAFLGTSVSPEAIRISVNGADYPIWNPAGSELFFVTRDSNLLSVDTRNLGRAPVPEPRRLFRLCEDTALQFPPVAGGSYMHPYDTLDGKRFLVNCLVAPPNRFTVLLNWPFANH